MVLLPEDRKIFVALIGKHRNIPLIVLIVQMLASTTIVTLKIIVGSTTKVSTGTGDQVEVSGLNKGRFNTNDT